MGTSLIRACCETITQDGQTGFGFEGVLHFLEIMTPNV